MIALGAFVSLVDRGVGAIDVRRRRQVVSISVMMRLFDQTRAARVELGDQDSNLDKQNQNLLCYRYTIAQEIAAAAL